MVCQLVPIYKTQLEGPYYKMLFSPLTADIENISGLSSLATTDGSGVTQ